MSQRFVRCPRCRLPHAPAACASPPPRAPTSDVPRPTSRPPPPLPARRNRASASIPLSSKPPGGRSGERTLLGRIVGGKYVVRGIIGQGAMGTVFEAEHLAVGCKVALKVLRADHARKEPLVERFRREARAAGRLVHPNVCHVHDLDYLDDSRPYLVMERLVGETLAERLARQVTTRPGDIVDVLIQALSALAAAHERGLVHRDVKPENLFLVARTGCRPLVKVLDFGVSKSVGTRDHDAEELDLTRRGMVMGTPHYMAPEQAHGQRDLDGRVDVYACGVVLYQALTGRRPFEGADHGEVLRQVIAREPDAMREPGRGLPDGFGPVLQRAMAKDRERRYASAVEFQRALQTLGGRLIGVAADPRPHAAGSPVASPVVHVDAHPTRVWLRAPTPRLPAADEVSLADAAPTRIMRRGSLAAGRWLASPERAD